MKNKTLALATTIVLSLCLSVLPLPNTLSNAIGTNTLKTMAATFKDYQFNESKTDITITKYTGSATTVTIPSKINGKSVKKILGFANNNNLKKVIIPSSVTAIMSNAFSGCTKLSSVTISKNVTSIGDKAFYGCSNLTSITMPTNIKTVGSYAFSYTGLKSFNIPSKLYGINGETFKGSLNISNISVSRSNTRYTVVNGVLFSKDKKVLFYYPAAKSAAKYTIPKKVSKICVYAFAYNKKLTSVIIPSSVQSIDYGIFNNCTKLKSLKIPNGNYFVSKEMFYGCTSLTSVTLSSDTFKIDQSAFENCVNLKTIILPKNLNTIDNHAFVGTGLTTVTIPEKVKTLSPTAFRNCMNLTSIKVSSKNLSFSSIDGVVFSKNKTKLILYPDAKTNSTYTIPAGVAFIMKDSFGSTPKLLTLNLPNTLTDLYPEALRCTNLATINIPANAKGISGTCFTHLNKLSTITVNINNLDYASINGVLYSKDLSILYRVPPAKNLTYFKVPESVQVVNDYAFINCNKLTKVDLPMLDFIGEYAFLNCTDLKNIVLPNSITFIGYNALGFCASESDNYTIAKMNPLPSFQLTCGIDTEGERYAKKYSIAYSYPSAD